MTIIASYLVIAPLVNSPDLIYLYAAIFMASGFVLYYPLVYKQYRVPFMDEITKFLQILMMVAPTDWDENDL